MSVQTRYQLPSHTTASGTNLDTYFPSNGGKISTKGATSVILYTQRTADTGTCTFQVFMEYLYESNNTWYAVLDMNNATAVSGVLMADGAYDSSAPFYQQLVIREAPVEIDADAVKIVNTVHKVYQLPIIPAFIRYRFRHAGTTVTNTFSAYAVLGGVR
jgi:hypothetical protein